MLSRLALRSSYVRMISISSRSIKIKKERTQEEIQILMERYARFKQTNVTLKNLLEIG